MTETNDLRFIQERAGFEIKTHRARDLEKSEIIYGLLCTFSLLFQQTLKNAQQNNGMELYEVNRRQRSG